MNGPRAACKGGLSRPSRTNTSDRLRSLSGRDRCLRSRSRQTQPQTVLWREKQISNSWRLSSSGVARRSRPNRRIFSATSLLSGTVPDLGSRPIAGILLLPSTKARRRSRNWRRGQIEIRWLQGPEVWLHLTHSIRSRRCCPS